MKRVFSGIQPSGELHIGNYLGAVQNWVKLQTQHDCLFCVVDLHAITQPYDPATLPSLTMDMAVSLYAAGLDPNQIREVRETVRRLGETKTILLSTHILQEVEAMCNRVIFINEGRLAFDGTPTEFAAEEKNIDERFYQLSSIRH